MYGLQILNAEWTSLIWASSHLLHILPIFNSLDVLLPIFKMFYGFRIDDIFLLMEVGVYFLGTYVCKSLFEV